MAYWLFKSEPDCYSIDDLAREPKQTARWDGIRNYQARNLLRDKVALGDEVFFYHSRCKHIGIVGTASVVKTAYPDPQQYLPESPYFDPKATPDQPRWFCVDITLDQRFKTPVLLSTIKEIQQLEEMILLKQGRLSIQPVTQEQWQTIVELSR
ncbi:EVE domain-containing protein [Gilvimarinus sp. DA14]|uniref:EVE domain-containing protein n=1 Tax=Gilvimarinus sp. DA14 TaxID=2956798 RepID=UPI0020B7B2B2|nr:EVE domain-containing protein [Gilvimarinus sp. DA14]UTF60842.1 EVE domain-containing protein [Gilvimarinus sp. DA14]